MEALGRDLNKRRDIRAADDALVPAEGSGRKLIAVIGIDRYQHWEPLSNAVNDARGALALFEQLGFAQASPALFDDAATGRAIQSLVTDELVTLGPDDSVVLFYAGHGGNRRHNVGDREVTTGYLIPVDAEDKVSTWVNLEAWLHAVALLPAKHILVILDACHSGIALDPVIKWRDNTSWRGKPLATLNARRSRRIITSALGDQRAMDGGPYAEHSLFTGCLIEALARGGQIGKRMTTGSELGLYLRRRVGSYPHSQQTPDFGTFAFDDRGEMVIFLKPALESPIEAIVDTGSNVSTQIESTEPGDPHANVAGAQGRLRRLLVMLSLIAGGVILGMLGVRVITHNSDTSLAQSGHAIRNIPGDGSALSMLQPDRPGTASAHLCGNNIVELNTGEECDAGPKDSATCNSNMAGAVGCKASRCGDGYTNLAAGEKCDSGGSDTAQCNGQFCTFPVCGDNYLNSAAGEECESQGLNTRYCNGKMAESVACHSPRCGDGYVNPQSIPKGQSNAETCDNLGGVDTMKCNGNNGGKDGPGACQPPSCGDGYINLKAGEQCERDSDCAAPQHCKSCKCI